MNSSLISGVSTYPWSDSWLLYSVIHASQSEPADLAGIIAAGDRYNHAVKEYVSIQKRGFPLTTK
jgi:hypothetical protein